MAFAFFLSLGSIEDREGEEISPFLPQINKFIHSHRLQRRNVLVFSDMGVCRAPTIIAQYLIQVWLFFGVHKYKHIF